MAQRREVSPRLRAASGLPPAGVLSPGTGALLPDATLASRSGAPVALDAWRGRRNLVVLLLGAAPVDDRAARLVERLERAHEAIDEESTQVIVVGTGDTSASPVAAAPSTVRLVDPDGSFHRRVGATDASGRATPALFITDRFREIYHSAKPGDAGWPASADDVLSWLVYMNVQCPECGAPEW